MCCEVGAYAESARTDPTGNLMALELVGRIRTGTLDSAITTTENGSQKTYGFLTRSRIGDQIFESCKMDDQCKIHGIVDQGREWIVSVTKVEKIAE